MVLRKQPLWHAARRLDILRHNITDNHITNSHERTPDQHPGLFRAGGRQLWSIMRRQALFAAGRLLMDLPGNPQLAGRCMYSNMQVRVSSI